MSEDLIIKCRELAAQAWCSEANRSKTLDPDLALEFATIMYKQLQQLEAENEVLKDTIDRYSKGLADALNNQRENAELTALRNQLSAQSAVIEAARDVNYNPRNDGNLYDLKEALSALDQLTHENKA